MKSIILGGLAVASLSVVACAGKGTNFSDAEKSINASCVACHSTENFPGIRQGILDLSNEHFTAEAFPAQQFPEGLRSDTAETLRTSPNPQADADIPQDAPPAKAWILHEMHELGDLLEEPVPPDFTSESKFNDFSMLGEDSFFEGCEIGEKLDQGHGGDPEGMPPQWAAKLFELLGEDGFTPLDQEGRQTIRDYVDGLLPGGLKACVPGEDSAS